MGHFHESGDEIGNFWVDPHQQFVDHKMFFSGEPDDIGWLITPAHTPWTDMVPLSITLEHSALGASNQAVMDSEIVHFTPGVRHRFCARLAPRQRQP